MKNLKKAFALILAMLMVFGVMGIAGAAYSDFTDADKIKNDDAVSLMVELGVINGIKAADGSFYFDPAANVTRAQMAKMLSFVLNGGLDRGSVYASVNTGLTDTADNWARGYINHCFTLGLVAGMGDGTFQPNGSVTGAQAAKMLLVALGYDAQAKGLVGKDWLANSIALAGSAGILDGYTGDPTKPLSRDEAALLIYNALYAQMVTTSSSGVVTPRTTSGYEWINNGDHYAVITVSKPLTLLSDKFGMTEYAGTVTSNEFTGEDAGFTRVAGRLYKVSTGLGLIGHKVTVYQKGGATAQGYYNCFGSPVDVSAAVSAVRSTPFDNSVAAQSLGAFLKANGLKSIAADAKVYENYIDAGRSVATVLGSSTAPVITKGQQLTLIDSDGDKVADVAALTETSVARVKAVSASTGAVTFENVMTKVATSAVPAEDLMGKTDLAVGDYVLVTQIGNVGLYLQSATVVTGAVTKWNANGSFIVGGTTYSMTGDDISGTTLDAAALNAGATYNFILDQSGYVAAYVRTTDSYSAYEISRVLAYWYTESNSALGNSKNYYAYVVFPDGTKGSYKIATYNSKNPTTVGGTALNTLLDGGSANVATEPTAALDYGFVHATVNADGNLVLKAASTQYSGTFGIKVAVQSEGAIAKGVAKLGGSITEDSTAYSVYANSATSFYYIASEVASGKLTVSAKDAVYTGIANAPTADDDVIYTAYYTTASGTKVAAAVYYGSAIETTYADLYYFFGGSRGWSIDANGNKVYDVTMYTNGVAKDITVTEVPAAGFYGSYTLDADGNYVFGSKLGTKDWTPAAAGYYTSETLGDYYSNYLEFSDGENEHYGFVADSTKLVVSGAVADTYTVTSLADIYGILAEHSTFSAQVSVSVAAGGSITAIYVEFIGAPAV